MGDNSGCSRELPVRLPSKDSLAEVNWRFITLWKLAVIGVDRIGIGTAKLPTRVSGTGQGVLTPVVARRTLMV